METWLKLPKELADRGERLALECGVAVGAKMDAKEFTRDEIAYVAKLDMRPVKGELQLPDSELEKLRRLCQVWDVDFRVQNITSHRKIIGPVIVTFKKLLLPFLRVLLRNVIEQQKEFNASAIALLAEMAARKK